MSEVKFKAVPTEYKGIPFRSKLEAKYARALELTGTEYRYEPEVFDLGDGISYCPDFYLPEYGVYLEVKGVPDALDKEKIRRFSRGKRLIVCFQDRMIALNFPGKTAVPGANDWEGGEVPSTFGKVALRRRHINGHEFSDWRVESGENVWSDGGEQYLVRCPECGTVQFLDECGHWGCQSCGFYGGDEIIGYTVFGHGGVEQILELVGNLDIAPYKRNSIRSCINCRYAEFTGYTWELGCSRGMRKPCRTSWCIGSTGCVCFETAR